MYVPNKLVIIHTIQKEDTTSCYPNKVYARIYKMFFLCVKHLSIFALSQKVYFVLNKVFLCMANRTEKTLAQKNIMSNAMPSSHGIVFKIVTIQNCENVI